METATIGSLTVSKVGLGCNNFGMRIDAEQTQKVVDAAIDAGITYFDTADLYGAGKSEEFLGQALGSRRDQVIVATKFGHEGTKPTDGRGGDPAWIRASVEASLRRLGTDRIDHYQLHQPDDATNIDDTMAELQKLIDEGKVLELGCSNFSAEQIASATASTTTSGNTPFRTCQNHYSVLTRDPEDEVMPACDAADMGFVPYFPLESGLLTGKYTSTEPPEGTRLAEWGGAMRDMFLNDDRLAAADRLSAWAAERDHTLLDLAISYLTSNTLVPTVIAGATKPEQVVGNVAAAGWALSADERAEIAGVAG